MSNTSDTGNTDSTNNVSDISHTPSNKGFYDDVKRHSEVVRSLTICIQALQAAIKHNDFLCQSNTVDKDDYEESSFIYEGELARLIKKYKEEERLGYTNIPLKRLLKPPFDEDIDLY